MLWSYDKFLSNRLINVDTVMLLQKFFMGIIIVLKIHWNSTLTSRPFKIRTNKISEIWKKCRNLKIGEIMGVPELDAIFCDPCRIFDMLFIPLPSILLYRLLKSCSWYNFVHNVCTINVEHSVYSNWYFQDLLTPGISTSIGPTYSGQQSFGPTYSRTNLIPEIWRFYGN